MAAHKKQVDGFGKRMQYLEARGRGRGREDGEDAAGRREMGLNRELTFIIFLPR